MLTHCTLTGVDELTSGSDIIKLSEEFPKVEWGFLYSPKRQGQPGRYSAVDTIGWAFISLPEYVQVALHVCGDGVDQLLSNTQSDVYSLAKLVEYRNGRIQLNFNWGRLVGRDPEVLDKLINLLEKFPNTSFITQHNSANESLWAILKNDFDLKNHCVLFDSSGGQGILSPEWSPPLLDTHCGYAGGLGPDNLKQQLPLIQQAAGDTNYWIDMEGKLRSDEDWFYMPAVRDSLIAVFGVP